MAGLDDDLKQHGQTCVDVLCAYLRFPYDPDPGNDGSVSLPHLTMEPSGGLRVDGECYNNRYTSRSRSWQELLSIRPAILALAVRRRRVSRGSQCTVAGLGRTQDGGDPLADVVAGLLLHRLNRLEAAGQGVSRAGRDRRPANCSHCAGAAAH